MTWVKLDDQFADHPKIEAAGPVAAWFFVCGLCYSSRHLTDGFIPYTKAVRLADVPTPRKHIDRLVALGLWVEEDDGYRIRSYLEYQPGAEGVERRRQVRAEAGRRGGKKSGESRSKRGSKKEANGEANQQAKSNSTRTPSPSLTDSPNGESLPPDRPRAELVAVPSSLPAAADGARALTCTFWESAEPKPAVKFIALLKLVERFLEAGWPEEQVALALHETRAYTVDAITYSLRHRRETATPAKPKSFDALQRRMAQHQAAQA